MTVDKTAVTDLLQIYNLIPDTLERECSEQELLDVSDFISWDVVGPRLPRITLQDMEDLSLDKYNQDQKRQKLLKLWNERNGSCATFHVLITAMLKAKKRNEAEKVCKLLMPDGKSQYRHYTTMHNLTSHLVP